MTETQTLNSQLADDDSALQHLPKTEIKSH
jgi:hypothetical protein